MPKRRPPSFHRAKAKSTHRLPQAKNLSEQSARLAPLDTFDPAAFVPNQQVPEELCSFVLALALAYDDIKDSIYAYLLLKDNSPSGQFQERADWGMFTGLQHHMIRYQIGLVHELCELIRSHQAVLNHPFLQSVVMQMPRSSRDSWQRLVDTATGKLASGPLANILMRIRHKVVAHYDAAEIYRGYMHFFFDGTEAKKSAYVSRGNDMDGSRLYFADAATQGYLDHRLGQDPKQFFDLVIGAMEDANSAIMFLVNCFIQRRGIHYRRAS